MQLCTWKTFSVGFAALASLLAIEASAQACGGLFCSSAQPVNQKAERIVFAFDKKAQEVTAVVEILYEGPSERFAWVLPVPGIPKIGVSSTVLLDRIQARTNPIYNVARQFRGCKLTGGSGGSVQRVSEPELPHMEVQVLASGTAGPYDYEVLKVDMNLDDRAQVAIDWLKKNQYDVGMLGPDVLRPYLDDGMNLLAFKLSKSQNSGAIRPIMLSYKSEKPMIPIRPTAVAANEDMGVLVWVLSSARAVPINYKTLELNEALIDWFNPATTYNQVVIAAADEAGGQGFVTELATPATVLQQGLLPEERAIGIWRASAGDENESLEILVDQFISGLSVISPGVFSPGRLSPTAQSARVPVDGMMTVLKKHIPLPDGLSLNDFVSRHPCHLNGVNKDGATKCPQNSALLDLSTMDREAFVGDVESLVIKPLENTEALFQDHAYVTRLYTTLSPKEMNLDPVFDLNPDLGDVSNRHALQIEYTNANACGTGAGAWRATINGQEIRGQDSVWPLSPGTQSVPANRRVISMGTSGQGKVDADNTEVIGNALASLFPPNEPRATGGTGGLASGGATGGSTGGATGGSDHQGPKADDTTSTGSGCAITQTPRFNAPWGLLLLALLWAPRLRRRK